MRTAVISHSSIINKNREQFRKIPGEVRIFGPSKWYDKSYRLQIEAEISEDYTPVTVLFKSKPNLHLYSPFLLRKLMEYSPDIIFVHEEAWAPACAFTAFFSGGRLPPFVFYSNEQKQEKISTARRIIQDYVFKKASGAVAVSKAAASRIKDNGFSAPVCVVPYSINQMPSKGYFPGKVLKAGYIGRFIKEKGVLDLAEALKGVDGITVKTAGDGPCAEEFKNSVENSGVPLDFMGYVPHDKTDNFYSGIDILIIPTRKTRTYEEQFGRALTEAAARGIPVIASDSGELPSLIKKLECGLVFSSGDVATLRDAIIKLKDNPELGKEFSVKGRENSRRLFSPDTAGRQLGEFLRTTLKGSSQ